MEKLSKESAEWHYEKLLALHNFEYLTLAQKVTIFYHDLEHDILKQITGKEEFFAQFNWLRDNQLRVDRNIRTGEIRKNIIADIDNLKSWRNEGIHENNMPEPKYRSHLHTMAEIISFFSEIPIPDEIKDVFNNRQKPIKKPKGTVSTSKDHTQYIFNGETFGKGRLVLAVVKEYVKNNKNITLEKLQNIFYEKLQGKFGVVNSLAIANNIRDKTGYKRYFLDDVIVLNDGQEIVVCTEWGPNISRFLARARELGYKITEE